MLGDEITPNDDVTELSDEELDEVAGGFSLSFKAARFASTVISNDQTVSGSHKRLANSAFKAENIESSFLQVTIVDATTDDLKVLNELFGGSSALDGSA